MRDLTIMVVLLVGFFAAPIVHWRIRRTKCWGARTIIGGLVFAPGLCATTLFVWFWALDYGQSLGMTPWKLVYFLQGRGGLRCLMVVSGITATYLGVCLLWEHLSRRADCDEVGRAIPVVEAWRSLVAIQLVLMGGAAYLYTYNTLGDAVVADDLALAEKRLDWNIEGLGPNNGLIAVMGSHGEVLCPLLPVAVKNGNYDLVKSLVKHGADLNPEDWNTIWALESETYVTNPLYFAVIDHDVKMIDFLLDLGANPDHGLYTAIMEHDRELAEYFLEKGASLEFALGVAKEKGYSQQRIDRLSADYAPKSKVDTDR